MLLNECTSRAGLSTAQVRYDNLDPEDFGITEMPDIEAVLAGRETGREADELYDQLDDSGALYRLVDYLNDDYDTRSAMLQILVRHMNESEVLQKTIKKQIEKLAEELPS